MRAGPPAIAGLVLLAAGGLGWLWLTGGPSLDARGAPAAPLPASPLAQAAEALVIEGQAEQALTLLERDVAATLEQLAAGVLLVDLSRHLADGELAVERGEALVARWPERADAHLALANALGTHMREGGLAAAIFSLGPYKQAVAQAQALDPRHVDARVAAIGFQIYAPSLVGADKQEARRLCQELVTIDPAAGAMMLALLHEQEGQSATALSLCREAAAAHPQHQELGVVYASLAEQAGHATEAMQVASRVVDGPPTAARFRALYQLARLGLAQSAPPQLCLDQLDEVLALAPPADFMPDPAELQRQRGRALERLGRAREAADAYRRALELDPELTAAHTALQRLD